MSEKKVRYKDTWNGLVRSVLPEVPRTPRGEDFLGYVLWNETAYPFADASHVRQQLTELRQGVDVRAAYQAWLKGWHEHLKLVKLPMHERAAYLAKQKGDAHE